MSSRPVYFVLLSRREDCSRERFLDAWLGEHRLLLSELPGLTEVRLLPVAEPEEGGYDGVGLLFFESEEAMARALQSEPGQRLRAHTGTFANSAAAIRLVLLEG